MVIDNDQSQLVNFSDFERTKIAIVYNGMSVSYGNLFDSVNQLSNDLDYFGINKGDIVAIYMSNSVEMVIAIFATMKCGAVVLPINIALPQTQIDHILLESNAQILLCNFQIDNIKDNYVPILRVNYASLIERRALQGQTVINCNPKDLAYCIYTSGSSGIPKGVLLTYEGIINHINAKVALLNLTCQSRMCLSFNLGFVASIWQILTPILLGARLYIYDSDLIKKPYQFLEQIEKDKIQVVSMIPHTLYGYLQYIGERHSKLALHELKHVVLTGEKVDISVVRKFYNEYDHISLINAYGQTECSDDTFHYVIPRETGESNIPIGRPIPNILYRILDEDMNEVIGTDKGELYIGGLCLSRGYVNDSNLASKKFFSFSDVVYYRTGDVVKHDENHNVVYLGRTDNQIKIHGHRIEPEGVEEYLNRMDEIQQAIVTVMDVDETDKKLVAFYTSTSNIFPNIIISFLSAELPQYMIPSAYKRVEQFVENSNGKIDRARLGECVIINNDNTSTVCLSDDLTDKQKKALKIIVEKISGDYQDNISLDLSFDDLALDSITFISMIIALEDELDFEFGDEMLLTTSFPTIKSLLDYVEKKIV